MAASASQPPPGMAFYPNAFSAAESAEHLAGLLEEIPWEQHSFTIFGRTVPMPRRIQMYGPHGYSYSGVQHPPRVMSPRLQAIADRVKGLTGRRFNSVLANWYRDGADSMGWHTDDDYPHGGQPMVASVSFGADRRFRFRPRDAQQRQALGSFGILLTNGSVLTFEGPARAQWQHALPRTRKVIGSRVNLTFRFMCGP